MRLLLTAIAVPAFALSALAQEEPTYRDDRSSPAALVESLYNAISRREYARAWSYFAEPPAETLEDYAAGFENTRSVAVRTGAPNEEGAAGSLYFELPVAISALDDGADYQTFAGCYTIRLAQPANQDVPFRPMAIEAGSLSPTSTPFEEAIPTACEGRPVPPHDAVRARAIEIFEAAYGDYCMRDMFPDAEEEDPQEFELSFRPDWRDEADPEERFRLFRFFCSRGAYNQTHIHLMAGYDNEIEIVNFAVPVVDIRYVDDNSDGELESMEVIGMKARSQLVNSEFDPETREMRAHGYWRGLGDASDSGVWIFRNGTFYLVRFEYDPTYDGEINPQVVYDLTEAP
jgi:hypothetical protein